MIWICLNVSVLPLLAQKVKKSTKAENQNRKIERINLLIEEYAKNHLFNGSVLVEEKGKVIFKKSYGSANMEWNIPNAPNTKFRIGSITKQFTATLILLLEQEGKIDLQANVTQYLSWYRKKTGEKITIENLLKHTSGIPNFTASASVLNDIAIHNYSRREIAEKFLSGDLEFAPGTKFSYDNSGDFLLGIIYHRRNHEKILRGKLNGKDFSAFENEKFGNRLAFHFARKSCKRL